MRLIDADACWDRILNGCCTTEAAVMNTPTIDPVHAAGGYYCKECIYKEESTVKNPKDYWCQLRDSYMDLDGFCSEGRKDAMKNETI